MAAKKPGKKAKGKALKKAKKLEAAKPLAGAATYNITTANPS